MRKCTKNTLAAMRYKVAIMRYKVLANATVTARNTLTVARCKVVNVGGFHIVAPPVAAL